jgi:hypothetical protein
MFHLPCINLFNTKFVFSVAENGLPRSAHVCVQSGAATSVVPWEQGWLQHEASCAGDHTVCPAEVSKEWLSGTVCFLSTNLLCNSCTTVCCVLQPPRRDTYHHGTVWRSGASSSAAGADVNAESQHPQPRRHHCALPQLQLVWAPATRPHTDTAVLGYG